MRAGELKRRRDFVAGVRGGGGNDDVTMTSRQQLVPDDMSSMTSLCVDEDDVSVCLQLVGSRSPLVTYCCAKLDSALWTASIYKARTLCCVCVCVRLSADVQKQF